MADLHPNGAVSLVAVAPSPASSGTTLTVTTGQGARFASPYPYNLVIGPAGADMPTFAGALEIVRLTGVSGDVLTITRAQESTSARTVLVGDLIYAGPTKKTFTDLEATIPVTQGGTGDTSLTAHGVLVGNGSSAVNVTTAGTANQVLTSNGASADPTFQAVSLNNVDGGPVIQYLSRQYFK